MASKHKQRGFWNFALPAIASVAGSLIGKSGQEDTNAANADINSAQMAFNREEAQKTRDFNAKEAEINRAFQTNMRATQYTTAMDDMKNAGLNPMLAYQQGGAGTPAGSAASASNATAGSLRAMGNTAQAGINGALAAAQIANINSQTKVNEATAEKTKTEIPQITANTEVLKATVPQIVQQIAKLREETTVLMKEGWNKTDMGNLIRAQEELAKMDRELKNNTISLQEAQTRAANAVSLLNEFAAAGASNQAQFENTLAGDASPWAKALRTILQSAKTLTGK